MGEDLNEDEDILEEDEEFYYGGVLFFVVYVCWLFYVEIEEVR